MIIKGKFVSQPVRLNLGSKGLNFERADIEFQGLEQSGPSFEGRVFLDNPAATLETPTTREKRLRGFLPRLWLRDLAGRRREGSSERSTRFRDHPCPD